METFNSLFFFFLAKILFKSRWKPGEAGISEQSDHFSPSGRSRGAIISQYYNRTLKLRRRRQSRPSIQDFSRSARPSIRGYGIETDAVDADDAEGEEENDMHLSNTGKKHPGVVL